MIIHSSNNNNTNNINNNNNENSINDNPPGLGGRVAGAPLHCRCPADEATPQYTYIYIYIHYIYIYIYVCIHPRHRFRRGDDTVGSPHRAQIRQFELCELILLLRLDKQLSIEQFEPTVSQSTVPSPPLTDS